MSSGHLASTVCPHVGGKADLSNTTSAADCADQVTRCSCVFRAGVRRENLATSALLYLDSNAVLLNVLCTHNVKPKPVSHVKLYTSCVVLRAPATVRCNVRMMFIYQLSMQQHTNVANTSPHHLT